MITAEFEREVQELGGRLFGEARQGRSSVFGRERWEEALLRRLMENPEFKVIIRGDRNISYRSLDPVLLACVDANVKNVTFNTAKP